MWVTAMIASFLLASTTSATYLGLLGRANRLCPAVIDTIAVTSTLSITVPAVTVTVTPALPIATLSIPSLTCLSDAQATSIVDSWKTIITHTDRNAANATAQKLIAEEFLGTSDSISSLAGSSVSLNMLLVLPVSHISISLTIPRRTNS